MKTIEKVTAFITQQAAEGRQLLLFEHPYAGLQIPAGTVEPGETPEQAVLREIHEETSLQILSPPISLGHEDTQLPPGAAIILPPATVYARPDKTGFDWIQIRSAVQVEILRKIAGFTQIAYTENDQEPAPNYISMQITGWLPNEYLATIRKRYFYYLDFAGETQSRWEVFSDNHTFTLFWASLNNLPGIIPPQNTWLEHLMKFLGDEK